MHSLPSLLLSHFFITFYLSYLNFTSHVSQNGFTSCDEQETASCASQATNCHVPKDARQLGVMESRANRFGTAGAHILCLFEFLKSAPPTLPTQLACLQVRASGVTRTRRHQPPQVNCRSQPPPHPPYAPACTPSEPI